MSPFRIGQFIEHDGLLAVVVGTADGGLVPEDHVALWYGHPRGARISSGGHGGERPEVWTVPVEHCVAAASPSYCH